MGMNFLNLHYFVVVCEELNITRAAERLFISQQSLSKHILKLEEELQIQLFNRTPTLSLTYAGTRLLKTARQILDLKRQIINEMDDINNHQRGELRIGISHTRGRVILPKILPDFRRTHPYIDVCVVEGNTRFLEDSLSHGRVDLLVGFGPILLEDVESVDLFQERIFLVVPKELMAGLFPDRLEEMVARFEKNVDVAAFRGCPFLMLSSANRTRIIFDKYVKKLGIPIQTVLEMESIETLLALACKGMGITLYPELFVKNLSFFTDKSEESPVYFFPLAAPSTIGTLVVGYSRERYLSEAARDFIALAKNIH